MNPQQFKNLLRTFSDPGSEILVDSENLLLQVNDYVHECKIEIRNNSVYILQGERSLPALNWILKDLARIDIFANRILNVLKSDPVYVYPELKCDEENSDCNLSTFDDFSSFIRNKSILNTGVVYLTSDAGEGKTSFVTELAINQAKLFSEKKVDYLIVPISLGGRTFHRFDDIVMGSLANKYRFPFMNFESFMEMVKLRVIIPALDGFEEMFVENGSGEALSAMGILLNGLDSCGSLIVSARKAYYEFENLKIQPKLFDVIRNLDVQFYKVEIERWDGEKFVEYLNKCGIPNSNSIYSKITDVLPPDHAILSRPVLAKKFVDLIRDNNLDKLLPELHKSGNLFFESLVRSIIEREANEKWLEKSGSDSILRPLIPIQGHYDLLSLLSAEMWSQKKEYLNSDIVNFVIELYAESQKLPPEVVRQIRDRLKGHALIVVSKNDNRCIEFDHEEFKDFFFSRHIANLICKCATNFQSKSELISIFRKSILNDKIKSLLPGFIDKKELSIDALHSLENISIIDGNNSYAHQNSADIIIILLSKLDNSDRIELKNYNFGINALSNAKLNSVDFLQCIFASTNLDGSEFNNCKFIDCEFENFPVGEFTKFSNSLFINCAFLSFEYKGRKYYDPFKIQEILQELKLSDSDEILDGNFEDNLEMDEQLIQLEKILRYFLRSTHISESVIRMKLGNYGANVFINEVVPVLESLNIIHEIENKGGVNQKRFKLGTDMSILENAIESSKGDYNNFISKFKK